MTCYKFSYTAEKKERNQRASTSNFTRIFFHQPLAFCYRAHNKLSSDEKTFSRSICPLSLYFNLILSFSQLGTLSPTLSIFCHAADFSFASLSISASHCSSPSISPHAFVSLLPSSFCQCLFLFLPSASSGKETKCENSSAGRPRSFIWSLSFSAAAAKRGAPRRWDTYAQIHAVNSVLN